MAKMGITTWKKGAQGRKAGVLLLNTYRKTILRKAQRTIHNVLQVTVL